VATKAGSVTIDVTADIAAFTKAVSAGVTDVIKRINPLKIFVLGDTTEAMNSINDLVTYARGADVKVLVGAETDRALNEINEITVAATNQIASVEVLAATDTARVGIQELGAVAAAVAPVVDVVADVDTARAEIQDIAKPQSFPVVAIPDFSKARAEKDELAKPISIPVTTTSAGGTEDSSGGAKGGSGGGGILGGGAKGAAGILAGLGLAAGLTDALAGVGDVDQALGRIGINAEFTGSTVAQLNTELAGLKDVAGELGANPKFGAFATADFVQAAEVLTKANLSIEETKALLPAVGNLAITSGQDLISATAQLVQFRQVLKVKPGDENNVVDILTNADIAGTFGTILDYSTALGAVGLQYTNMIEPAKRGVEATKELLGTFTFADNAGIRVGRLGTTYQSFLSDISGGSGVAAAKQITKLTEAFKEQGNQLEGGGDIFFKANGSLRDMVDIQDNLRLSTEKLNPLQKAQTLNTIFQSDSQQFANALQADTNGTLEKTIELMNQQGFAAKYADNQTKGYKGAIEGLKGSFGGLSQSIGDVLKGPAEAAVRGVGNFIGEISGAINAFDLGGIEGLGAALAGLSGPAKIALAAIVGLGAAAVIALAPVVASAVLAAAPFVALGLAIAGIGAAVVIAYEKFPEFKAAVDGAFQFITTVVPPAIETAKAALTAFGDYLVGVFGPLIQQVGPLFQAGFDLVVAVIDTAVKVIKDLWDRFGADLLEGARGAIEGVKTVIEGTLTVITGIFNVFKSILTGDWQGLWDGIKQIVDGVWTAIKGIVDIGWSQIKTAFEVAKGVVSATWSLLWNSVKTVFSDIWGGIKSAISAAMESISGVITGVKDGIVKAFRAVWDAAKSAFDDVMTVISGAVRSGMDKLAGFFDTVKSAGESAFKAVKGAIEAMGKPIGAIVDAVQGLINLLGKIKVPDLKWPSVPDWVPGFADGALVRGPIVAQIGEAGPEVVLPLTRPERMRQLVSLPEVRPVIEAALAAAGRGSVGGDHFEVHMPPIHDPQQWLDALQDRVRLRRAGASLAPAISRR